MLVRILTASCSFCCMQFQVSTEEGARLAEQLGSPFFETSAVSRQCVDDTFHGIVREIRRKEHEELLSLEKQDKKRLRKKRMHAFFSRLNIFRRRSNNPEQT